MTRRPYDWSQEELETRRRCLESVAMCLCVVGIVPLAAFGAWWTIRGYFNGWLLICAAAVLALFALCIGLEDDQ